MEVIIYSKPSCNWCRKIKEFFRQHGIEYEDIDVTKHPEVVDRMMMDYGEVVTPLIEINDESIMGFDRERLMEMLHIPEDVS